MNYTSMGNKDYLVYSDLADGMIINHICYVLDVSSSISRIEQPFYRVVIRTVDGVVMVCPIFNIEEFNSLGFKLNYLKGKYIRLEAGVMENNGRFNLRFRGLKLCTEDLVSLSEKFQRKLEDIDSYYEELNEITKECLGMDFPKILKVKSYPSLYNGYGGGFVMYSWNLLMHCQIYSLDLDVELFRKVLLNSLLYYSNYLDKLGEYNIFPPSEKVNLVGNIPNTDYCFKLVRETVASLIGLSNTNHLIPSIIKMNSDLLLRTQKLKNEWTMLRPGGVINCEGIELIKY